MTNEISSNSSQDNNEAPHNKGIINTGCMGNVSSGSGNQFNLESQQAKGDIINNWITHIQESSSSSLLSCPVPPPEPLHFGGRNTELAELKHKLKADKLVALTSLNGSGGIGKTTLARKLAYDLYHEPESQRRFRAVLWLEVGTQPNETELLISLGQQVDPEFSQNFNEKPSVLRQRIRNILRQAIESRCPKCSHNRVLFVLDDVWDDGVNIVKRLLELRPENTTTLVITRSNAVLTKLGVNLLNRQNVAHLSPEAGIDMLKQFLSDLPDEDLLQLTQVLKGFTLALKLAAKRLQNVPNPQKVLAQHIRQYQKELPSGNSFFDLELEQDEDKEENLTLTFYYSYTKMSGQAQYRFRMLGALAYATPFNPQLLAILWDLSEQEAKKQVIHFWNLGLVELEQTAEKEWYSLHPILHSYARTLLKADPTYTKFIQLKLFNKLGKAYRELGEISAALTNLEQALTISRQLEDKAGEGEALGRLSHVYRNLGVPAKAIEFVEQALVIFQQMDDKESEGYQLASLGLIYRDLGKTKKAISYYNKALAIFKEIDNKRGKSYQLGNLGEIYLDEGKMQKALECYRQALVINREINDRKREGTYLNGLGAVYKELKELGLAAECYHQALEIEREVGDKRNEGTTLWKLGEVYCLFEDFLKAKDILERALTICREASNRRGQAFALRWLAKVCQYQNELPLAVAYQRLALEIFEAIEAPRKIIELIQNDLRKLEQECGKDFVQIWQESEIIYYRLKNEANYQI